MSRTAPKKSGPRSTVRAILPGVRVLAVALACVAAAATTAAAQRGPGQRPVTPYRVPARPAPVRQPPPPVWLGITYQGQGSIGDRVVEVHPETGAAAAGLRAGDEIIELAGMPVPPGTDLSPLIRTFKAGDRVPIRVVRDGHMVLLQVTMTARPSDQELLERRLVDKPAPPLDATRLSDGGKLDLDGLAGKVAVLAFFPPGCDACAGVISGLGGWARDHDRDQAVVLGVSDVAPAGLRAYLSRNPIVVPAASVEDATFEQYVVGPRELRVTVVVIDGRGTVRLAAQLGPHDGARLADVCVAADRAIRALRRR